LPTLPAVAVRVIQLSESPDASIGEIAAAIEFDQALVVRLLRTVNSSYYGLQRECGSVAQAMSYLGLRAIRSLVLGFSLAKSLDGGGENDVDFPWRTYWRRGVRAAAAARYLARFIKGLDVDEAQVAGLLADVGMVALYRAYGDRYLQALDVSAMDSPRLLAEERRSFNADHSEVGQLMADRWQFPEALVDAIGRHEQEPSLEMTPLARVAALASIAERAIREGDLAARAKAEAAFLRHAELALSMTPPQAAKALEVTNQRAFELAAMLELDVGPAHDPQALVERARGLRGPTDGEGTRDMPKLEEAGGFEERLAAAFERSGEGGGVAVAVVEPDGSGPAGGRPRRDDLAMSRLEATMTESVGGLATVHRISTTLVALVFETSASSEGDQGALRIVERLRRDIETRHLTWHSGAAITISAGMAIHGVRRFESPDALIRAAMLALAAAQRSGRNRVGHFKPSYDPMAT